MAATAVLAVPLLVATCSLLPLVRELLAVRIFFLTLVPFVKVC